MPSSMNFMKTLTVLCNVVLFGFTCLVTVTEGAPRKAEYIIFTLSLVLIPIFTVFAVVRSRAGNGRPSPHVERNKLEAQPETGSWSSRRTQMERVAAVCNIVLLGFVCWAVVLLCYK